MPSRPPLRPATSFEAYIDRMYATAGGHRNKCDVYVPRNGNSLNPCVVFLHGGGWLSGDKADNKDILAPLVAAGFVVVSANYRFSTQARWPAQLIDVKKVIRALRANASAFRIWPDKIGVWGSSAGGHLALMAACTNGMSEFDQGEWAPNNVIHSGVACSRSEFPPTDLYNWVKTDWMAEGTDPQLVVNFLLAGTVDSQPARAAHASPTAWVGVTKPTIPIAIRHGVDDELVAIQQARRFKAAAQAANLPNVTVTEVPGMKHGVHSNIDFPGLISAFDLILR